MPAWSQPAGTGSDVRSSTPQSPQESTPPAPTVAALTFLQPEMSAAATIDGVAKSSGTLSFSSERPRETTQTVSHMR